MTTKYGLAVPDITSPISPISPVSSNGNSRRPTFNRLRSSTRRIASQDVQLSYKDRILRSATSFQDQLMKTYKRMTPLQRILGGGALLVVNVLGILFLVYSHSIFEWLGPVAVKWRQIPGGWLLLWFAIFFSAFPPLIGYSTFLAIGGFVWGFPNGWFIVATANVAGSLASFVACRTVLSKYVNKLVGDDKRFTALALVMKHDGLKILIAIRLCPLPYSISNGAMSTFPTVSPLNFALASALASPKLLIAVFIGSRLADIVENGGKMGTGTKVINYASIIFGALLGVGLGIYIYQRTIARARQLELEEEAVLNGAAEGSDGGYFDGESGARQALAHSAPAGMDDDDISLWDNDAEAYRDDFTDEENPFAGGYADEDATIGSKQSK
jgi:uncharacterized membrane protein YdjX (TVP38/TMEM64 family)